MVTVFRNKTTTINLCPVLVAVVASSLAVRLLPSSVFSFPVVTLTEKSTRIQLLIVLKERKESRLSKLPVSVSLSYVLIVHTSRSNV